MDLDRAPFRYVGGFGAKYRFTILTDGILRYEWAEDGQFEDRPSSFATQRLAPEIPKFTVSESEQKLEITTARFHLTYDKQVFSPHGLFALVFDHTRSLWRYSEHKPWENLGGTARTLDGVDGRVDMGTGIMSEKGYASIDDSDTMLFGDDGFVAPRRPGPGRIDGYLFAYGHDFKAAIQDFYKIAGAPPLLPRWALGNWWSRNYVYSANSYLDLVDQFHRHKVPLSVAVLDMDWHLVDEPEVINARQTGWTGYTWNKKLFPDPKAFIADLHEHDLVVGLNEHPADGIAVYEDIYPDFARAMGLNPDDKKHIYFDITDRRYMLAYLSIALMSVEQAGNDFWWMDWQQGSRSLLKGVDPLWVLNHFHFSHNAWRFPKRSPFVFSRYAGPGSHRYSAGFSGDTIVSWASLNFQPEFTATASNIGYVWWSHDIGGHMNGVKDEELTARWVQLGVFSPIMRLHSTKSRWVAKEPWKLDRLPGEVISNYLRLRHRLIPYLHSMNSRCALHGLPLVQPLYWEYPQRPEAYQIKNQYFFGSELMVIPITSPQNPKLKLAKVKGWLPPGNYVDFFTGTAYQGDRWLWLSRDLETYPVLMKEGSIVPIDYNPQPRNGVANPDTLLVVVAVGADAEFELLEEVEGPDQNLADGSRKWSKTEIIYTHEESLFEVTSHGIQRTRWAFALMGVYNTNSFRPLVGDLRGHRVTDKDVIVTPMPWGCKILVDGLLQGGNFALYLGRNKVQFDWGWSSAREIEKIIDRASIQYDLKDQLWEILSDEKVKRTNAMKQQMLSALEMEEDLRIAICEHLADAPAT